MTESCMRTVIASVTTNEGAGPAHPPLVSSWVSNLNSIKKTTNLAICWQIVMLSLTSLMAIHPESIAAQTLPYSEGVTGTTATGVSGKRDLSYSRPTSREMVNNFLFDGFGPYPLVGAAFSAGIDQWTNTPPEWNQGMKGYSRRFGSDYGISLVGTTTRYALSEALREDTLYYRCECRGVLPRFKHAVISTVTARRGKDGHRVVSISALLAPYAGSATAVSAWYPDRYGAKDVLRMGNYSLLAYIGGNVALEFFYSGPHSLLSRMHLNNSHGARDPGPRH